MISPPTDTVNDRIKLPLNFDSKKMMEEINTMKLEAFNYYDAVPLRAPAHLVDTSLPTPVHTGDFADGSWTEWSNTAHLINSPYIMSVVNSFQQHTKVTLVRLLRLEAGAVVKEHTDPTLGLQIPRSVVRLTIPIQSGDDVIFYLNRTPVEMKEGECWYMRLTDPHSII